MMNKILKIAMWACAAAVILSGCKPTERNYRAAYDAALAKRQAEAEQRMLPATGLMSDDGPQLRVVGGDSVYVVKERLRPLDGDTLPDANWALGVGVYKMGTNAKAQAEALKKEGFPAARAARAAGDRWYAIADTAATLERAVDAARRFRDAHPGYPYVGLPGAPVLISF